MLVGTVARMRDEHRSLHTETLQVEARYAEPECNLSSIPPTSQSFQRLVELVAVGSVAQGRVGVTHHTSAGAEEPADVVEALDLARAVVGRLDAVVERGVPQLICERK
eukprot:1492032-Rhodomonas_salina.3